MPNRANNEQVKKLLALGLQSRFRQRRVAEVSVVLLLFAMALTQTHTTTQEHYVFIAFYLATGVFAAYYRLWYAVAAMTSAAVVRFAVVDGWHGVSLQVVSALFAGFQLLLVIRLLTLTKALKSEKP